MHAFEQQLNKTSINVPELISEYLYECERQLIPNEYLDWIEPKNKRQCNFIWKTLHIQGYLNDITMVPSQGNSNKHSIIIKALDRITQPNDEKRKVIIELRRQWSNQTSYKGFKYDWLNEKSVLQCEKAIDFLSKKMSDKCKHFYFKPPLVEDGDELNDYYKFLASVDLWECIPSEKESFHDMIKDSARKWSTEKPKPKPKKNSSIVKVTDKKSLSMLEEITIEIGAKNKRDALKTVILEKHATLNTPQIQENDEELRLNNDSTVSDNYISPQEHSEITSKLEVTKKALAQLEEKALSQLKTMCEKIVRLEGSELVSRKLNESQKKKVKEKVEEKKNSLLSFKSAK